MKHLFLTLLLGCLSVWGISQEQMIPAHNKFRQMGTQFNTPNAYRTASGAPGQLYWQQQANYRISVKLDESNQTITGEETIEYINHSPDVLTYLWVQLDQNRRQKDNITRAITPVRIEDLRNPRLASLYSYEFDGGFRIESVTNGEGNALPYTINHTMMRIDLPEALRPGQKTELAITWWYNINDRMKERARSGMEYFEEDDNYIFTIAQFFPRMAVYSEVEGWQNNQFFGKAEFALPFGNYEVEITVPADHVVGATGELLNKEEVLSKEQISRLDAAMLSLEDPVFIVSEEEAIQAEKHKSTKTKTWKYKAENVRDFAFASSRKFIWDGMGVKMSDRTVLATSLYPKEGNPLWEEYSTRAVAHTLKVFSRMTFNYPYPVAYSVHTAQIGMEYPMISFNLGRPEKDGSYTDRVKYRMISVIIHEVGHNYFPMIVNSDERQWTWMDEGLNTFVQTVAELEWQADYPFQRGMPQSVINYMKGDHTGIAPIMMNGELLVHRGPNAYGKPSAGLMILRETIMGRELFDFAFKEYANRWKFKHPTPEDFFRTMEDASAMDLDWFWRGWFYTTDRVDIALDTVIRAENERGPGTYYQLDFSNVGGMLMPLVIQFEFADGSKEIKHVPAQIWSKNNLKTSKLFLFEKEVAAITLDPNQETADCDTGNNHWPPQLNASRFERYKRNHSGSADTEPSPLP